METNFMAGVTTDCLGHVASTTTLFSQIAEPA